MSESDQAIFEMTIMHDIDVLLRMANTCLRLIAYAVVQGGWDAIVPWDLLIDDHNGVLDSIC